MLYPSMKTLLKEIGNRYLLVNVVARRAREIADEAEERGEPLDSKPVTLALGEIADGALTITHKKPEDPEVAMEGAEEPLDEPQEESGAMDQLN